MQNYFDTNSWSATNVYEDPPLATLSPYASAYGGGSGGIPQNCLIDRDGDVRKYAVGAIDGSGPSVQWENAIKKLVGVS
jgi:hypothetical protein